MGVVGEAVSKDPAALGEGLDDAAAGDDGAERRVSAGDALAGDKNIGRDVPVLGGKVASGTPEAGHDLIGQ